MVESAAVRGLLSVLALNLAFETGNLGITDRRVGVGDGMVLQGSFASDELLNLQVKSLKSVKITHIYRKR